MIFISEGSYAEGIKEYYEPLNNNEKFKNKFKKAQFKVLLNPSDDDYAALIIVDKGTISVEIIANKPEENISKKVLGWDAMMETTRQMFDDIDEGKISTAAVVKKMISGKIKAKNIRIVSKLDKIQAILTSK